MSHLGWRTEVVVITAGRAQLWLRDDIINIYVVLCSSLLGPGPLRCCASACFSDVLLGD